MGPGFPGQVLFCSVVVRRAAFWLVAAERTASKHQDGPLSHSLCGGSAELGQVAGCATPSCPSRPERPGTEALGELSFLSPGPPSRELT